MARLYKLSKTIIICVFFLISVACSTTMGDVRMLNNCGDGQVIRKIRNISGLEIRLKGPTRFCEVDFGNSQVGEFSGSYDFYLLDKMNNDQTSWIVEVKNATKQTVVVTNASYDTLFNRQGWEIYPDGTKSRSIRKHSRIGGSNRKKPIYFEIKPGEVAEVADALMPDGFGRSDDPFHFYEGRNDIPKVRKIVLEFDLDFDFQAAGETKRVSEVFDVDVEVTRYEKP